MAPPPGRLGRGVKLPVQVRLCPEAIAAVDAFAAELSQQRDGAAFRRAEALRMAALEWLKARQARRVSVTTAPSPPAVPATVAPRPHEAAAAAEEAAMAATPAPPKRPGRARAGR